MWIQFGRSVNNEIISFHYNLMDKSTVEKKIPLAYQVIKDMGKSNFVPVTLEGNWKI